MIGSWEPTHRDAMTGSLAITLLAALGAALVLGTIAHRLRMAPMIGYIAAGLVVGPFTPGFVADHEEVQALADIGVALLMFSIGLQFRLAELWQVGRLVLIGAPLQVAITMALGIGTSVLMGIPFIEALFIGASVSVCSSVVLAKVAGERALEATLHGRIALSWSIVQDLLTVVLVVLLSAVAAPAEDPFVGAILSSTIALGFVAAVLVIGSRVLPALLGRIAHLGRGSCSSWPSRWWRLGLLRWRTRWACRWRSGRSWRAWPWPNRTWRPACWARWCRCASCLPPCSSCSSACCCSRAWCWPAGRSCSSCCC